MMEVGSDAITFDHDVDTALVVIVVLVRDSGREAIEMLICCFGFTALAHTTHSCHNCVDCSPNPRFIIYRARAHNTQLPQLR